MFYNQKNHLTLLFSIIITCLSLNAQEVRVVDNKGTIKYVNNNKVTTSNTAPLSPLENDIWFDTNNTPTLTKIWDDIDGWKMLIAPSTESKTVILNRNSSTNLNTGTNTFYDLPLNTPQIQFINTSYYSVVENSEIKVLHDGNYLISGEISVTNMPSGDTKFILGVFINGIRRGYLSRGFTSFPSQDYWGTTGTLMYALNQNDLVNVRYVINAGGTTLNSNLLNIGITKL
ncbi:hypothetical protein PG911_07035 [Tenacibaculum ovolyticum]|uniref:hypothetical protein n=1 Tax=Tenacibaculum ovolyticum TaxID=104270 RepID=UPI0022F3EB79|nr:hypothetical protein [Tenacibaculum ovolyticum]WBX78003.1 hypothetical protein PG911_07035 [Tenacibaculum ovolyticum]